MKQKTQRNIYIKVCFKMFMDPLKDRPCEYL